MLPMQEVLPMTVLIVNWAHTMSKPAKQQLTTVLAVALANIPTQQGSMQSRLAKYATLARVKPL
jgi:hypothetical protein